MLSSGSLNRRRRRRQPPYNDTTFSGSEAEDSPVRGQQHKLLPPPPSDAFKRAAEHAASSGLSGISALNIESRPGGGGFSRRNLFTADDPRTGVDDSELNAGWSRLDSAAVLRTTMKSSRRTVRTEEDGEPVQQQMTDGVPVRQQLYVEERLELRREEEEVVTRSCTSLGNRQVLEGENEVPLLKTPEQKNRDLDWR
jgi:hypothetical protein